MPDYYDPVKHLGPPINHQRMYDFERDILRVKNPLNQDFEFVYDGLPIVIPSQGTKDIERYLVRRYVWNMIGYIYQQFTEAKMAQAEEAFRRNHPDVMDDPYLMNTQIYDKMKRADDPEFQKKVIADCVVGVVSRFGQNRKTPQQQRGGQLDPNTPLYMSLIDDFKTAVPDMPAAPLPPLMQTQNSAPTVNSVQPMQPRIDPTQQLG